VRLARVTPERGSERAGHRHLGLGAIYAHYAVEASTRAYRDAFAGAARATGAVIVAGSAFLPDVDEEPLAGVHASDARTCNVSLAFGPHGGVLGRWAKVHLTPGHERASASGVGAARTSR
jgi:glycine/D-amino acid oxidase-like deaminating enzyme